MTTPAAGWFPDPAGLPDGYRWWDGAAWTRYLTDDPAGPPPDAPLQAAPGDPVAPPTTDRTSGQPQVPTPTAVPPDQSVAATTSPPGPPTRRMPPGYDFARPARPVRVNRRPLIPIVSILVAVVIGAVVVAIAVNARTEATSLLEPPPPVTSTAPEKINVNYDPVTRIVIAPPLQVTMPGAPYKTAESSIAGYGVFAGDGVESSTIIEKNYNGKGDKWVAVVAAGVFVPELAGKNAQATAEKVFERMSGRGYEGIEVSIKHATSKSFTGHRTEGWIATGEIHYSVKGIESTYDTVSVLVLDAGGGNYVGWINSRPNKSEPAVKAAVSSSVKSIKVP